MRGDMMRAGSGIIGVGLLLIACASTGMAQHTFTMYRSTQSRLPVSFEYPADWQVEPSSGMMEAYTQVQLYGPASLDARLRTYMVVRVLPPKGQGGRFADAAAMADDYRKTLMPTLHIDQERQTQVLGTPAAMVDVSGTLLLPWKGTHPTPVPVKSQRVFFEKAGRLYELSWMATPEASAVVEQAFTHLLATLRLTE